MLNWLKGKAVAKEKSNIDIILGNLVPICARISAEIAANGDRPLSSGPLYELMMKQRVELYFQLNGPMTVNEVRAHVEPFLSRADVPAGVRMAVEATIDEYESRRR
jgi:hypothetical protein